MTTKPTGYSSADSNETSISDLTLTSSGSWHPPGPAGKAPRREGEWQPSRSSAAAVATFCLDEAQAEPDDDVISVGSASGISIASSSEATRRLEALVAKQKTKTLAASAKADASEARLEESRLDELELEIETIRSRSSRGSASSRRSGISMQQTPPRQSQHITPMGMVPEGTGVINLESQFGTGGEHVFRISTPANAGSHFAVPANAGSQFTVPANAIPMFPEFSTPADSQHVPGMTTIINQKILNQGCTTGSVGSVNVEQTVSQAVHSAIQVENVRHDTRMQATVQNMSLHAEFHAQQQQQQFDQQRQASAHHNEYVQETTYHMANQEVQRVRRDADAYCAQGGASVEN